MNHTISTGSVAERALDADEAAKAAMNLVARFRDEGKGRVAGCGCASKIHQGHKKKEKPG